MGVSQVFMSEAKPIKSSTLSKTKDIDISLEEDCVFHKHNIDFDLPDDLLDELFAGKLALFAGSGISTENKLVLPDTFYQDIAYDLGYDNCDLPFSSLID